MRTWNHLLWACVASLAFASAGCPGNNNNTDGGVDQAAARPSGGPLAFTEIIGQGPGPTAGVRLLSPLLTFRDATTPNRPDDLPNTNPVGIGCSANHFNTATSDLPVPSANAGTVRITGFQAVTPMGETATYNAVDCQLNSTTGSYDCTFGNTAGGAAGPSTSTPIAATDDPIRTNPATPITFAGQGGGSFGTFSITINNPADTITSADFSAVGYTGNQVTTIPLTCTGGNCTGAVVANIDVTQAGTSSPTSGHITCAFLSPTGSLTIPVNAVNAMLGCDGQGANCDSALTVARTVVVRFPFPTGTGTDSNQNNISNVVAGQGVFYQGPIRPAP
jgi:hypothetical protein